MLPRHLLVLFNIYLRNYAMTSYVIAVKVMIHESDISIKLLEYQSESTRIAKIREELLNMCREREMRFDRPTSVRVA